jgi:hypothetical protein
MWPAVLAVAACAVLVGPASAAAAPPTIESEWVTGVTEHNAVLHATINPNGTLTQYKLQFDESGTYHFYQPDCGVLHVPGHVYCQHVTPGDERIEPPEGSIPAGGDAVEVSVDLASIGATIEPNTTYNYRAIAANGAPEVEGPDQTFTTPPVGSAPPSIEGESVSNVSSTDATLEAQINPSGFETAYELQIDTTGNFKFFQTSGCPLNVPEMGCTTEVRSGDPLAPGLVQPPEYILPASDAPQHVSVNMAAIGATLQPGTTYHYRALAANRTGYAYGPDQTFTTLSPDSSDSPDATPPGQPLDSLVGQPSLSVINPINPAPSLSHPRRAKGKHKRHHPRRHNGSARSTRTARH